MLGISARRKVSANAILREFYSHAERHPHGWGLALFPDGRDVQIEKEPVKATESVYLAHRLDAPIEEKALIAHIRLATIGQLEYANCHPFSQRDAAGRTWTLAHNGTIFLSILLDRQMEAQAGDTDSERILLHIVAEMNREISRRGRALDEGERFDVLARAVAALAEGNKLNLLVYDGEVMYAHSNFRDSLFFRETDDAVQFSSRPLAGDGWAGVPFLRLVAAKGGSLTREGAPHGHEYHYDPGDYRFVYMNFANL
ncbi:MAG: class II glutamine amidotransferase [Kiritimatiellae bacterium]|nr:class II glutamine amidotransferase [Kiritimatiellia bacterium]